MIGLLSRYSRSKVIVADRCGDPNQIFDSIEALRGKVLQVGKKKFIRLVS